MSRRIARLKPKKVKGRITTLKALPYRGNMTYVRKINSDIFEYLTIYKGQIYSNYMVITPRPGQTKMSDDEISQAAELLWSGAEATIDTLMGITIDTKKAEVVKAFEGSRKQVEEVLPN